MDREADVAVVGAGIVGLAFAWEAARRGRSVVVIERGSKAEGASIRNFGMVWPIGQRLGACYQIAMNSRERWLEARDLARIHVHECGSLHSVYNDDELQVVEEFVGLAKQSGVACEVVPAHVAKSRWPALQVEGLRGVLYSPTELCVDPRQAIDRLAVMLAEKFDTMILFDSVVTGIDMPRVYTARGETWHVNEVFVCSGTDFVSLFPQTFSTLGMRRCKLQMMRTAAQPNNWRLGPHIAGPLTLTHYQSFTACPSLPNVRKRLEAELAEYFRFGIHVMASQNAFGEVVIGDSHEYDEQIAPFDRHRVNQLILTELQRLIDLPDWRIDQHWHGQYAKHPTKPFLSAQPQTNCHIISGVGGAGMTMSFGYARAWFDAVDAGRSFVVPE
jgi:D-hydroxyproline dehydrogenase subunit beta